MGSIGGFELVLIFMVVLLIFGAKKIPEIARGVGKGIKEFKSATSEISKEINTSDTQSRRQQPIEPPRQGEPTPRSDTQQQTSEPPPEPQRAEEPSAEEAPPREQKA